MLLVHPVTVRYCTGGDKVVPYAEGYEDEALAELEAQAETVVLNLSQGMVEAEPGKGKELETVIAA